MLPVACRVLVGASGLGDSVLLRSLWIPRVGRIRLWGGRRPFASIFLESMLGGRGGPMGHRIRELSACGLLLAGHGISAIGLCSVERPF